MITITVFAPPEEPIDTTTRAMSFVEGVFSEARLVDKKPPRRVDSIQIQKTLIYLMNRYPRRIRVRWVNPWSIQGLFFALVNRQRKFPAIFIKSKSSNVALVDEEINTLPEKVNDLLSQPETF